MSKRVQLNEKEMEQIVGGAFNFYTKDGQQKCYVDGIGTFYCSSEAFSWVVERTAGCDDPSSVVVQEALDKKLFWT